MNKIKFLYHGSPRKLIGDRLLPKKAKDLDKNRLENTQKAVYATDRKDVAIAMAIVSSKGANGASLSMNRKQKPYGTIYSGWPKQKEIYLHYLPHRNFKKTKQNSHQFISKKAVKPIKTEKLEIKKYLQLIKKASKDEAKKWFKRYNIPK